MTVVNTSDAKNRRLVRYPRPDGTGHGIGRLTCIGGKRADGGRHPKTRAVVLLPSGAYVTTRTDLLELVPEAPRSVPT